MASFEAKPRVDSSGPFETALTEPEVVDLSELDACELEPLWRREVELWLENLYWDVSPVVGAIRRAVRQKQLTGKAARLGGRGLGYCYYMLEKGRAVLGSLVVAPDADASAIGSRTLECVIHPLQSHPRVRRIESQFVSFGEPWLEPVFASHDFDVHERVFLRRMVDGAGAEAPLRLRLIFELWTPGLLEEASLLMQHAHSGRADAEMNELYRTREGCQALLENILYQRGCGKPIPGASIVARDERGRLRGLVISTEISPRHAHLAQVAVSPAVEGMGLGRALLTRALCGLGRHGCRTISLMVSSSNHRAYALYASAGFGEVLRFPVFSWDRAERGPRSR